MRNLIVSIVFSLVSLSIIAQGCLPEGITFTTQTQIDSFAINYPTCTEIEGDVTIGGWDWGGSDINNLNGLSILASIGGSLSLYQNNSLLTLEGLDNLNSIGGDLSISFNSLSSLTGLDNVTSIGGGLEITYNDYLTSISGLQNLTFVNGLYIDISNNGSLISLSGLENLTSINGILLIFKNDALISLSGLENITSIGSNLGIIQNHALTSLSVLEGLTSIGSRLDIYDNDTLTSLSGLDNLNSIGGRLHITDNNSLTSLSGLGNLNFIGGNLSISLNPALNSLEGLEKLTSIEGYLIIDHNDILTSLTGLDNIDAGSISNLSVYSNELLSTCDVQSICDYVAAPNAIVEIHDNAPGCNSQQEVEEACASSVQEIGAISTLTVSPNPFTSTTALSYYLPQPSTVQISIYNHLGKQVDFIQQDQSSGPQQITWDASDKPSGVYYFQLKAGDQVASGKLLLVR